MMGSIVQLLVHRERNCMFYALWVNKTLGNLSLGMLALYESYSPFPFFFFFLFPGAGSADAFDLKFFCKYKSRLSE